MLPLPYSLYSITNDAFWRCMHRASYCNVYISRPTRCTNSYNVSLFIIKCSTCFGHFSPSSGAIFGAVYRNCYKLYHNIEDFIVCKSIIYLQIYLRVCMWIKLSWKPTILKYIKSIGIKLMELCVCACLCACVVYVCELVDGVCVCVMMLNW